MRGADGQQAGMFSYVSPERRIPADHPLRPIREMTDTVLRQLSTRFARLYAKTGFRGSRVGRDQCALRKRPTRRITRRQNGDAADCRRSGRDTRRATHGRDQRGRQNGQHHA
jgi:hypothetical protein